MIYTLTLPIHPVPASRPRVYRRRAYYNEPYNSFRGELEEIISSVWDIDPLDIPLQVDIWIYADRPQNPANPYPSPDWDNYAKAVCDAMNGIVYVDDKQIVDGRCVKQWSEPGEGGYIIVEIVELNDDYSIR